MNKSRGFIHYYLMAAVLNLKATKSETSSYLAEAGVTADCEDGCIDLNGANLIDNIHGNYGTRKVESAKQAVTNGSVYYVIDLGAEREVAAVWLAIYGENRERYITGAIWVGNESLSATDN